MKQLRTIFAGTPDFAVPSLDTLAAASNVDIVAVYSQPDRRAGRGQKVKLSAVKQRALALGLRIEQPESLKTPEEVQKFSALQADLLVVAAYGLMLPQAVLDAVRYPINVHASLLPRWRGAAPIQRSIMVGDCASGISIMRVIKQLDAGPVWLRRACQITPEDTGGTLHDKLAALGAIALNAAIELITSARVVETPQNDQDATYADKITAQDRVIDWTQGAAAIARKVRALAPQPGCQAKLGPLDVKLLQASVSNITSTEPPATVTGFDRDGINVATGTTDLRITALQPAGKQIMTVEAFINGYGKLL